METQKEAEKKATEIRRNKAEAEGKNGKDLV